MSTWVYSYPEGAPSFYIQNDSVYGAENNDYIYFIRDGWWYAVDGGKAAFYTQDKTIYTPNGKPAYYYSE
jgi:hypothetical protein